MNLSSVNLINLPSDIPSIVDYGFDCSLNKLTSLNGSPTTINGGFDCAYNMLSDLCGGPKYVDGSFDCGQNFLKSLLGAPTYVEFNFWCGGNPNLLDVSDLWNSIIKGVVLIPLNKGLGLLPLIKFKVEFYPSKELSNFSFFNFLKRKHFGSSKQNIIEFQYDLIETGYGDMAKWKP